MRRARTARSAMFLHDAARDEVHDRLGIVNKTFSAPAVVSGFAAIWGEAVQNAAIAPDDEILTLRPGAHDLVIHGMGLHWANDPVGQLIQSRRALQPDGLFLGLFLGGRTLQELREVLSRAEVEVTGGLSPRFAPMIDIRDAGSLLQRAGFALPVADLVSLEVQYRDIWHLMRDLRAMGETNILTDRLRHPTQRAVFNRAQTLYTQNHSTPDGRIVATFDTIVVTGWAPAEDQPKPLRPGSAKTSLAQALGTNEVKLPD